MEEPTKNDLEHQRHLRIWNSEDKYRLRLSFFLSLVFWTFFLLHLTYGPTNQKPHCFPSNLSMYPMSCTPSTISLTPAIRGLIGFLTFTIFICFCDVDLHLFKGHLMYTHEPTSHYCSTLTISLFVSAGPKGCGIARRSHDPEVRHHSDNLDN